MYVLSLSRGTLHYCTKCASLEVRMSQYFTTGIVHPGIYVHFDIVFLNDHCGIVQKLQIWTSFFL